MKKLFMFISVFIFCLFLFGVKELFSAETSDSHSLIWAFTYKDKIGAHYGRIRVVDYGTRKIDLESPFYLDIIFRANSTPNSDGSRLFESKKSYKKPDLSKYDFYLPYKDPEPKIGLLVRVRSFDSHTLDAEIVETTYGTSSVRHIKLNADSKYNFYGICEGSYLREYKITKDDKPALGSDWRLKGVDGKEYWLLIEKNGKRLYKDTKSVVKALNEGLRAREEDIDLLAASEDADTIAKGTWKSTISYYERMKQPVETVTIPEKGELKQFDELIQKARQSGADIEGENIIVESINIDSIWSKEKFTEEPANFLKKFNDLVLKGEFVGKEDITRDSEILKLNPEKSEYKMVKKSGSRRALGSGKTEAEALAGAVIEASSIIRASIKKEVIDIEKSGQKGTEDLIKSKSISKTFDAIKHFKVVKFTKNDDENTYDCEIEFIPGKIVQK